MKTLIALIVTATLAAAGTPVNIDKNGVGIKGYDPVAYFTDNAATKGNPAISTSSGGVVYYFASADHKAMFDADPAKYTPQFGGFCAYAVSKGTTAKIDPQAFQIVDGRLLLQYDTGIRATFNKDTAGNLKKADANWPAISAKLSK